MKQSSAVCVCVSVCLMNVKATNEKHINWVKKKLEQVCAAAQYTIQNGFTAYRHAYI